VYIDDVEIPVDGGVIVAHSYWPENASENETFPLIVNYHGGGFFTGHAFLDHPFCIAIVKANRIAVLNVDYRRAPEHPFPIPVNDCYTALKWGAAHTDKLKADLSKGFIIVGSSAGGSLAAAAAILARDDPSLHIKPTGLHLVVPELCSQSISPPEKYKAELQSVHELADKDPFVKRESILWYHAAYEGKATEAEIRSFKRSPLFVDSYAGLPPAVIQVCGRDHLRDEGILYSKLLSQAIGEEKVKLIVYPGATHGFHYAAPNIATSKKFVRDMEESVGWLLQVRAVERN